MFFLSKRSTIDSRSIVTLSSSTDPSVDPLIRPIYVDGLWHERRFKRRGGGTTYVVWLGRMSKGSKVGQLDPIMALGQRTKVGIVRGS